MGNDDVEPVCIKIYLFACVSSHHQYLIFKYHCVSGNINCNIFISILKRIIVKRLNSKMNVKHFLKYNFKYY